MKYIYNNSAELVSTFFNEVDNNEILNLYPDHFIFDKMLNCPELVNGKIIETQDKYYTVYCDENNKVFNILKGKYKDGIVFEGTPPASTQDLYLIDGVFKVDKTKRLKMEFKEKARELKHQATNWGFIFKENLRQPCREQDKTSMMAQIMIMQTTKTPHCEWKFFDKDTGEHIYKTLSLQELLEMSLKAKDLTLNAMKAESHIQEDLKKLENLENYDLQASWEQYFNVDKITII